MKNCTQSKQSHTFTLFACLIILLMLASIVSSCDVIVQTPVPTANNIIIPPTATKTATEIPTIVNTPESTPTDTPEPSPLQHQRLKSWMENWQRVLGG